MLKVMIGVLVLAAVFSTEIRAESKPDECSIRDSAMCLANKNCHWDGSKPGCYPGPAPYVDPCSAHDGEAICNSDNTLGCAWTAAKQCESKVKPSPAN
jgi:hypothetical protein